MNLVTNGKLKFPLYHQTSSIYLDSIKMYGFCGVNIIQKFEILESLRNLIDYAKANAVTFDPILISMLNQECSERANFRHGGGYVTPSQQSAVRYATDNAYGSELISNVLLLANTLASKGYEIDALMSEELVRIRNLESFPVLIKIDSAPISALQGENKESFDKVIGHITEVNIDPDNPLFDVFTQQLNFEVISALDSSTMTFLRIIFEKPIDPIFPRYSLEEI